MMQTQLNSETEKRLEAGGGIPGGQALFADALLASYWRAIESVAAARDDIRAAALRLAAIWRTGGGRGFLGGGFVPPAAAGGCSMWAQVRPALRQRRTRPSFPAPSASTKVASRSSSPAGSPNHSEST